MNILIICSFIFLNSCAKISYIAEQGVGQVALEYNDIDNDDFLKDPNQSKRDKDKVRVIEKAKKYFFNYFEIKENSIYDEVKILNQEAVTYLVIHSKKTIIQAEETSFAFMGSFPYLGFFSIESAKKYQKKTEKEGFHTYRRPVYAYSTLNSPYWPFTDNILSSFFNFTDEELTELIFHELVHTIIFVENNVSFNENLAQFIAGQMLLEYFNYSKVKKAKIAFEEKKRFRLNQEIVQLSHELGKKYKREAKEYGEILKRFIRDRFTPHIKQLCKKLEMKKCWPLRGSWNNARFAAFRTYEEKQNELELIFKHYKLPLKKFVLKIIELEKKFDEKVSFLSFLKEGK